MLVMDEGISSIPIKSSKGPVYTGVLEEEILPKCKNVKKSSIKINY